ncbi:MAG: helix-turn-helix transcriptional regulator [Verrucomicrobiota bacterium]
MPKDYKIQAQLKAFGANVRRERTARGMTQEKLAEAVELNIRTIQKIEAGVINVLVTTALRIQKALGCPWSRLMPG